MTEHGPVEKAMRAMVDGMGGLTVRQSVIAAQAFVLAAALDGESDGSKAAALSRELRALVGLVTSAVVAGGRDGEADPVAGVVLSIEAKRRKRAAAG